MMHRSRIFSESFLINFSEFGAQKKQKDTVPKESIRKLYSSQPTMGKWYEANANWPKGIKLSLPLKYV